MSRGIETYVAIITCDEHYRIELSLWEGWGDDFPVERARTDFGPFDGTVAVSQWLVRQLAPMLRLPLG